MTAASQEVAVLSYRGRRVRPYGTTAVDEARTRAPDPVTVRPTTITA
ncbi:hypothetical protein ABZ892_09055 [Streptomyces sp. NPDC046924]